MSKLLSTILPLCLLAAVSCQSKPVEKTANTKTSSTTSVSKLVASGPVASASVIMGRKQVPVLCYHQIRDWKPTDSKTAKDYIIPIAAFKEHMKMLADSGYHTILPDQLYAYLANGAALPSKPIVLTFDDTDLDQFTIARPEMKKYGFKGVFFIMTVSLGRPHYMSKEQVKQLSDEGNIIGSHTWDHHNFKKFAGKDWETQLDKPTKKLEEITGKKIDYFAYPFGLWNEQGLPELHKRGFKIAFQLADKRDANDPLMTVRRILDSGYWSTKTLSNSIKHSF
ncbi:polysaccharide deacetylase family protein [Mucilaginibacter jinjuensis]|uniref:Polysaccharide deacetylase family protein n=1 Tax=Mucilaginibacter jinjuensis TaxID=1176721 RepID=A0ABY7TDU2_9SPHI|nr:polysaccharide deacetylase family protein [Mucilaginibacter jinjuensis]WCT14675.1 polysaccharide deacetylase family protein [Mucilaginibacter jinjuensis]